MSIPTPRERGVEPRVTLAQLIERRRKEILLEWEAAVRRLPPAQGMSRLRLLDHVPRLLDRIAQVADELMAGRAPGMPESDANRHALERLEAGFDLGQVITEFSFLRDIIMRIWERELL